MKVSFKKLNGRTVIYKHEGILNSKQTLQEDLITTIAQAYSTLCNNPNCNAVTITLRKEVK